MVVTRETKKAKDEDILDMLQCWNEATAEQFDALKGMKSHLISLVTATNDSKVTSTYGMFAINTETNAIDDSTNLPASTDGGHLFLWNSMTNTTKKGLNPKLPLGNITRRR